MNTPNVRGTVADTKINILIFVISIRWRRVGGTPWEFACRYYIVNMLWVLNFTSGAAKALA